MSYKTRLIIFISISTLLIILFLLFSFFLVTSNSAPKSTPSITSVLPNANAILIPNQKQVIIITFNDTIDPSSLALTLQKNDVYKPANYISVEYSIISNKNVVTIKFAEDVLSNFDYKLIVRDRNSGVPLLQTIYTVMVPRPTPVAVNNTQLIQYLPLNTNGYSFLYSPTENIYYFFFHYDPNSPDDTVTQRQKAITALKEYVQSKGIDFTSLRIKYSN